MTKSHLNLICNKQGIDLKAGGKSKKTKRTAPKSDDIYLKLLVKVLFPFLFLYLFTIELNQHILVFQRPVMQMNCVRVKV